MEHKESINEKALLTTALREIRTLNRTVLKINTLPTPPQKNKSRPQRYENYPCSLELYLTKCLILECSNNTHK